MTWSHKKSTPTQFCYFILTYTYMVSKINHINWFTGLLSWLLKNFNLKTTEFFESDWQRSKNRKFVIAKSDQRGNNYNNNNRNKKNDNNQAFRVYFSLLSF